jgi:signal transduction histidine kinase
MMRLDIPEGSPLAGRLTEAESQLAAAHQELRSLIRGLSPPVLADHGLVAAVDEQVSRFPIPVTVNLQLPGRLPRQLETNVYYLINEVMTNIARHSGATRASVTGRYHSDLLVLGITDDGHGGADPDAGTGLTGLADRLKDDMHRLPPLGLS